MSIRFSKYQGSGNDFILIDNRDHQLELSRKEIALLCHRRFGIGADGLILLESKEGYDFVMKNFNSDGGECSMCGNGGRSLVRFAQDLGIEKSHYRFLASDGAHEASLKGSKIELKMGSVKTITKTPVGYSMDTGSPHLVLTVTDLIQQEVVKEGRKLRHSSLFQPSGINVNFVEFKESLLPEPEIFVRTYERGVEDETLSCGTGAIAAALTHAIETNLALTQTQTTIVQCQGGPLSIRFTRTAPFEFENIWLIGDAVKTFEGTI